VDDTKLAERAKYFAPAGRAMDFALEPQQDRRDNSRA
jgi:hypothetical protein